MQREHNYAQETLYMYQCQLRSVSAVQVCGTTRNMATARAAKSAVAALAYCIAAIPGLLKENVNNREGITTQDCSHTDQQQQQLC
jgi:hypothetical protein